MLKQGHQSHRDLNLSKLALERQRIGATGRDFTLALTTRLSSAVTLARVVSEGAQASTGGELELGPAAQSLQGIPHPLPRMKSSHDQGKATSHF